MVALKVGCFLPPGRLAVAAVDGAVVVYTIWHLPPAVAGWQESGRCGACRLLVTRCPCVAGGVAYCPPGRLSWCLVWLDGSAVLFRPCWSQLVSSTWATAACLCLARVVGWGLPTWPWTGCLPLDVAGLNSVLFRLLLALVACVLAARPAMFQGEDYARGFLFLCVFSGCGSNYVLYRRISAPSRLEALGLTYLRLGRLPGQRPLGRFRLFFAAICA